VTGVDVENVFTTVFIAGVEVGPTPIAIVAEEAEETVADKFTSALYPIAFCTAPEFIPTIPNAAVAKLEDGGRDIIGLLIVIDPGAFEIRILCPAVRTAGTGSAPVDPIKSCPFVKGPKKLNALPPSATGSVWAVGDDAPVPPFAGASGVVPRLRAFAKTISFK
jgi:hypothetical protein